MISRSEARIDSIQTPLHSAVEQADLAAMQEAAKAQPWALNQLNHRGETPLHTAARLGNLDAVRELLKFGCDIDQRDGFGDTVLMVACSKGSVSMAQHLMDAGCTVDAKSNPGLTALHRAASIGSKSSVELIRSLLSAGASAKATTLNGRSVISFLLYSSSEKDVFGANLRMLLKAGVDLEAHDSLGVEPLQEAIIRGNLVGLQCLVEAGANTAASGPWGTILHVAAQHADHDMLSYLESLSLSGINQDIVDQNGDTAWDCFICVSYVEDWRLSNCRRPGPKATQAFVRLYQGVRDRNLDLDVKVLQRVRQHLLHKDQRGATAALGPMIKQKEEWKLWDLVETYKTVRLQIREAMWDAAIESVDENIQVLQEEMAMSPWEMPSHYNWLRDDNSDETESEVEDEVERATVHSEEEDNEQLLEIEEEEEEEDTQG